MIREISSKKDSLLIQQLPTPLLLLDGQLRVVNVSDQWLLAFGFVRKELLGIPVSKIFPEYGKSWIKNLRNTLKGRTSDKVLVTFTTPDGSERWFEWHNTPWLDDQGTTLGVIVHTTDVTHTLFDDIKMAQLETLLKGTSDNKSIGSWEYDAVKDKFIICDSLVNILGVENDFSTDMKGLLKFVKPGKGRKSFEKALDLAIEKGTPWEEPAEIINMLGKVIPVKTAGKAVFKGEEFLGLVGTIEDASDQLHLKLQHEAKERVFKSVFNSSYQFTGILDTDGTFLEVNETALKFSGLKAEDVRNKKFWEAYWWPMPASMIEDLKQMFKVAATGKTIRKELLTIDRHHNPIPIDFSLKPIYDDHKKVVSLLAEGRMIREMVTAREQLKLSEQKFRALYELSPVGYVLSEFDSGKILDFNESFRKASGYHQADLGMLIYSDVFQQSGDVKWDAMFNELNHNNSFGPVEYNFLKKNKTIYPSIISGSLVTTTKGKRFLWTAVQDMTDVKQKEIELREEKHLLKTLIDHLPLNVFVKDRESRKVLVNQSELRFCGLSHLSEIIGKNDFDFYDEETAQSSREEDLRVMNSCEPMLAKETINVKKDGTITTFLTSKIPLKDSWGRVTGLIGLSMDISAIKSKEKELNDLMQITTQQNKKLLNFAHIVSHDLRSHTANFSMLLEFLVGEKNPAEKRKIIDMLFVASNNLLETLENLNQAVVINTNINLKKKGLELHERIQSACDAISGSIKTTKATVVNNVPEDVHIKAVPAYLDSILMNFVTNAIKYRHPERDPRVVFSYSRKGIYSILKISDNGLGIDLEKHGKKLFGMYKTFHENPDARGIGLYLTRNQIEAMNGKIEVESIVGKGTVFTVYFNEKD